RAQVVRPDTGLFRVEHREAGTVSVLGHLSGVASHHQTLAHFEAAVFRDGRGGEVVLVDELDGRDVARRFVRPPELRYGSGELGRPDVDATDGGDPSGDVRPDVNLSGAERFNDGA